jgi:hemoglobin/transferrin/lactoferrin receptor protein
MNCRERISLLRRCVALSVILWLICSAAAAQTITVRDESTFECLELVTIFSKSLNSGAQTNIYGKADISRLVGAQDILISRVGYFDFSTNWEGLQAMNLEIYLTHNYASSGQIVVSASKFEEKASDVPRLIKVIESRELDFLNQSSTPDALQAAGQVMVQKSQLGGGSPIIRGFEANKILLVVDGVRMNNAIYRGGHLQNSMTTDNSMFDRMEVSFGPGSVIYGSDALGGVIHFYTRKPAFSPDDSKLFSAGTWIRGASAAQESSGHADFSFGTKNFASLTGITYSRFGDLRTGNVRNPFYPDFGKRPWYVERINGIDSVVVNEDENLQVGSGYTQIDALQKFIVRQGKQVQHALNLQLSTSGDVPRYDRLVQTSSGNPRFAEWYYGPQDRIMAAYTLEMKNDSLFYNTARITLSAQLIEESRHDRRFRSDNISRRIENLQVYGLNADFEKELEAHEFRYGIDVSFNDVKSSARSENIVTGASEPLDTRYPGGGSSMSSTAVYVTHAWEVGEKLIISDGIRLSNVSLDARFNDTTFYDFPFDHISQNNSALNGNLGMVLKPGGDWRISIMGASGFRAPNVDDLAKVFESVPGRVIVPNPDLKPEFTYNADFTASKTIFDRTTVTVNGFYTWYEQAITTGPGNFNGAATILYDGDTSEVITSYNAGKAYIYGCYFKIESQLSPQVNLTSDFTYTYARIKTDSTDYPLDHIPPAFGRTALRWQRPRFQGEFSAQYSAWKKRGEYNLIGEDNFAYATENGMPAWLVLNLRAAYQFNNHLNLQVAVENLLNHHYRVFASNISAPGRNLVVTLRARV